MRLAVVLALVAGCGFQPALSDSGSNGGEGSRGSDGSLEAMPGSEPLPGVAPCYVTNTTGLVLCLELDDPGLAQARDGSPKHHDAVVMNTNVATRDVPATSQAAQIISTSVIQTGSSTDFDLQTPTLMTWVHRENLPAIGGKYGLVHAYGQYYMAVDDQGRIFCAVTSGGTVYVLPGDTLALNTWDVAACTYDQSQLCAVHFSGSDPGSGNSSCGNLNNKTLATGVASGISIGAIAVPPTGYTSHLAGKLDGVRVYNRALGQTEICQSAGLSGC